MDTSHHAPKRVRTSAVTTHHIHPNNHAQHKNSVLPADSRQPSPPLPYVPRSFIPLITRKLDAVCPIDDALATVLSRRFDDVTGQPIYTVQVQRPTAGTWRGATRNYTSEEEQDEREWSDDEDVDVEEFDVELSAILDFVSAQELERFENAWIEPAPPPAHAHAHPSHVDRVPAAEDENSGESPAITKRIPRHGFVDMLPPVRRRKRKGSPGCTTKGALATMGDTLPTWGLKSIEESVEESEGVGEDVSTKMRIMGAVAETKEDVDLPRRRRRIPAVISPAISSMSGEELNAKSDEQGLYSAGGKGAPTSRTLPRQRPEVVSASTSISRTSTSASPIGASHSPSKNHNARATRAVQPSTHSRSRPTRTATTTSTTSSATPLRSPIYLPTRSLTPGSGSKPHRTAAPPVPAQPSDDDDDDADDQPDADKNIIRDNGPVRSSGFLPVNAAQPSSSASAFASVSAEDEAEELDEEEYQVESILRHKRFAGQLYYLVQWAACSPPVGEGHDGDWVAEEDLEAASEVVREYWERISK